MRYPKTCGQVSRGILIYCFCSQTVPNRNIHAYDHCVVVVLTKTVSATTVLLNLDMNGLTPRYPETNLDYTIKNVSATCQFELRMVRAMSCSRMSRYLPCKHLQACKGLYRSMLTRLATQEESVTIIQNVL